MSKKEKKDLRQKIAESLEATLSGINGELSPKKKKRNIRKASKALLSGLKVVSEKTAKVKKTATKPKAVEAVA